MEKAGKERRIEDTISNEKWGDLRVNAFRGVGLCGWGSLLRFRMVL